MTELCNGKVEYCRQRYNEHTFIGAHNAGAQAPEVVGAVANQYRLAIETQPLPAATGNKRGDARPNAGVRELLEHGNVRFLELDAYSHEGEARLCHFSCAFGSVPMLGPDGILTAVRQFMERHPREVVTLAFEPDRNRPQITNREIVQWLKQSGLLQYAYAHKAGQLWPSLGEMLAARAGQPSARLVIFTEADPSAQLRKQHPEFMYLWDHAFDTPYGAIAPTEARCTTNRPQAVHISPHRTASTPVAPLQPGAVMLLSNFFNAGPLKAPTGHDGSFNREDFLYRIHLQHCTQQPTVLKTDWIFNPQRSRHELLAVQSCLNMHGLEHCVEEWKLRSPIE